MKTTLKGGRIPLRQVYSEAGVIRAPGCTYLPTAPGWFCPSSTGIEYWDVVYEMMDEDHFKRRLSPLAVRGTGGYLDIINGPTDHTCCIGYACSMRLQTYHTTVACGKEFDYYFTSTIPVEGRFHFPHAPPECKIKIALYTKKPNRISIFADEKFIPPTNSKMKGDKIEWFKPNHAYIPQLSTHTSGANYHQRDHQLVHFIATGGSVYRLKVVQTLVLELGVMTELTEDQFYDNGNLAGNIAALLGIDEDKIRVMNVISESSSRRRRRHIEEEFEVLSIAANRFRREEDADTDAEDETEESGPGLKSIQFEIEPEIDNNIGAENLDKIAAKIVENPAVVAETIVDTLKAIDPTVESDQLLAVAAPPKSPEPPEPPVTLAEQLGVDEFESADPDDLDDFIESLNDAAGFDITSLPTAIEKQEEEQAAADEAADLVVYQTPVKMIFKQVISSPSQVLGQKLIEPFVLSMVDENGNHINNVGYVEKPWKVKVQLFEPKLASELDEGDDQDYNQNKKPIKMVTIEGSISTSYDFTDVEDDTTATYASIKAETESELKMLVESDKNVKTAEVIVTEFSAAKDSRRKREASEEDSLKAIAIFSINCEVVPSKMMTVEALESSVDSTIQNADVSDFESFDENSLTSTSITVSIVEPTKPTKEPFEEGSGEDEGSGVDEGSGIDEGSGNDEGSGSDEGSGESEELDGIEILEELHRRRRDSDDDGDETEESDNESTEDENNNDTSEVEETNSDADDQVTEDSDETSKDEDETHDSDSDHGADDQADDETDEESDGKADEDEEPETPSLDGETVVEFTPGSGLAIFDNLVFKGDLASTRLKFSITFPSDVEIDSLITEMEIVFVPEMEAECIVEEGGGFDRKLSFTEGCTKVCMAPCSDMTVGMVTCNKMKTCSGTEEGRETFGVCKVDDDGLSTCACDMDSVPRVNNLNAKEYLSVQCDAGSLEIRVNKCAMNKYGFSLTELFLHGPDRLSANEVGDLLLASSQAEDEEESDSSIVDGLKATDLNDCRGEIAFDNGPEYVFKIDRRLSDCNTKMEASDGNKELVNK